jgi:hypothetical protein
MATMCEIIDFVERYKKGAYPHLLMNDNWCPEAGAVSAALAADSKLLRQDLCAEFTTLNHYGLGGVGCPLVDRLFALAVRSRRAARAIHGSVADCRDASEDFFSSQPESPGSPPRDASGSIVNFRR